MRKINYKIRCILLAISLLLLRIALHILIKLTKKDAHIAKSRIANNNF